MHPVKPLHSVRPQPSVVNLTILDYVSVAVGYVPQVYAVHSMDVFFPYTVTLDSPYGSDTQSGCELFRQGTLGSGVAGYQYIVTFDSNVGDLPALMIDGSGLKDSYTWDGNQTTAKVIGQPMDMRCIRFLGHVVDCALY